MVDAPTCGGLAMVDAPTCGGWLWLMLLHVGISCVWLMLLHVGD